MPIKSLQLRAYVHATEDKEKVLKTIENILSKELLKEAIISEETYHGHYGNPITVLVVSINDSDIAEKALRTILDKLGATGRHILYLSLEDRVDKNGSLFFRLSKQDAYQGVIVLYEADDVVKIMVTFSGKRAKAMDYYRRMLELEEKS